MRNGKEIFIQKSIHYKKYLETKTQETDIRQSLQIVHFGFPICPTEN